MEERLAKDTVKYLYSVDEYLKNNTGVENRLRQGILQKARLIELRRNVDLPKKSIKPRLKCPKCCMPRSQGLAEYKLQRNKIGRFHKKLKKKVDDGGILTKYQEKYLKKKKHNCEQILEIRCKVCSHKVLEDIKKPKFVNKKNLVQSVQEVQAEKLRVEIQKKGKRGKKNKTKGKSKLVMLTNTTSSKVLPKTMTKNKRNEVKELPKKIGTFKNNMKKSNNINALLNSSYKIKNVGLKDFIKSVT